MSTTINSINNSTPVQSTTTTTATDTGNAFAQAMAAAVNTLCDAERKYKCSCIGEQ